MIWQKQDPTYLILRALHVVAIQILYLVPAPTIIIERRAVLRTIDQTYACVLVLVDAGVGVVSLWRKHAG